MRRLNALVLLTVLGALLAGCASSAIVMAPERPDLPWTPATTPAGEIIPDEKPPPEQPRSEAFVLPSNIGINVIGTRRETDSMGEIEVPADRYWGAQTACRNACTTPMVTSKRRRRSSMLPPDGCRNGRRTPLCALPTRRSAASWTSIFRFMSGRPDQARSRI